MEKVTNNASNKKNDTKKVRSGKKEYKERKKRKHEMLRIVVRQLPPLITKEEFLNDVSPLPEHSEFYIGRGCPEYKEYNFSRVYLTFKKFEDVLSFKDRFDGYVFVNDKGHEYTAIVEFSPLQKMPDFDGLRVKEDPKMNTIENDPEYVEFAEILKQPTQKNVSSPDSILEEIQNRNAAFKTPQVTPLMEFIIKRREEERRKKDEKKKKRLEEKKAKRKEEKVKEKGKKETSNVTVLVKSDKNEREVKVQPKKIIKTKEAKTEVPKYKVLGKKSSETPVKASEMKPSTSGEKLSTKTNSSTTKQTSKKPSNESSSVNPKVKDDNNPTKTIPAATFTVKVKTNNQEENKNDSKLKQSNKDGQKVKNKDRPDREIYKPRPRSTPQNHHETSKGEQAPASSNTSSNIGETEGAFPKKRTYRTYIRHRVNQNKPA